VSRLLATQAITGLEHFLEHITVTDLGLDQSETFFLRHDVQAQVAHDRDDEGVVAQLAAVHHVEGNDGHDHIAIDRFARFINRQHAVSVTVKGDTDVAALAPDQLAQTVKMGRTTAIVDVGAIGRDADGQDLSTQI